MNVVLDTNVFISGIFWKGNFCSQIIDSWRRGEFTLISSVSIIEELTEILRDFKIQMPKDMIEAWKDIITQNSIIIETENGVNIIKHASDNKFLEAAIEGNAKYIVSQDKHLLKLKEYKGIKIVLPEDFLKITRNNKL